MFYTGSGSDYFLILDPDPNIFSSRILHEKWNANLPFSCFLCFQEQSLSPRSGIQKKFIPDPDPASRIQDLGGKKAPDLDTQH
jgi:hypothetical protein